MPLIAPKRGVLESRNEFFLRTIKFYGSSAMIKMQMREEYISDIVAVKAKFLERAVQGIVAMEIIMGKEFFALFVSDSGVNQSEFVAVFYQQASHGPGAHVVIVCRIGFLPNGLWYNTKHGAAVQFEHAGFYRMKFHAGKNIETSAVILG